MASLLKAPSQDCVLIRETNGIVAIPRSSPLRRLHYFDGKFLRAEHLTLEQDYQRRLVEASNQAGGAGVVYGLDCTRAGNDELEVGPGMAIDPQGRVILLPQNQVLGITDLIERSRQKPVVQRAETPIAKTAFGECETRTQTKPGIVQESTDLYLITVGHTEACCGTEDVYGKLCEEACVTSTSRPYIIEGVVFRAEPLPPEVTAPLLTPSTRNWSANQLRSRVASAYFRYYDQGVNDGTAPSVLTTGLACLGARLPGGENVPIALLARQGCTTLFLDTWIARRERMEAPARTYWAGCLHLRPWHVFLAQVLQFQCHLNALFPEGKASTVARDPCQERRTRLADALKGFVKGYPKEVEMLRAAFPQEKLSLALQDMRTIASNLEALTPVALDLADQVLIQGGIVELPSAGYLPVDAKSAWTVNQQVRQLLGGGLDLRFCRVRPDYIPHALEEAQHLERISLLQGLKDPKNKPEVDILVPDGTIRQYQAVPRGTGFVGQGTTIINRNQVLIRGAGRAEVSDAGGLEFCFSATDEGTAPAASEPARPAADPGGRESRIASPNLADTTATAISDARIGRRVDALVADSGAGAALWLDLRFTHNPFALAARDATHVYLRCLYASLGGEGQLLDWQLSGTLLIDSVSRAQVKGKFTGATPQGWQNLDFTIDCKLLSSNRRPIYVFSMLPHLELRLASESVTAGKWDRVDCALALDRLNRCVIQLAADPEVFSEEHPEHRRALAAIEILQAQLKEEADRTFGDVAARRLFPPPLPQTTELQVLATQDWVLFHRRRHKECEAEPSPPPPPPAPAQQSFCLYVAHVDDAEAAGPAVKLLKEGQVPDGIQFSEFHTVAFDEGSTALTSETVESLRNSWRSQVSAGDTLRFAAIAPADTVAGEEGEFAERRLETIYTALITDTPKNADFDTQVLQRVPQPLAAPSIPEAGVCLLLIQRVALSYVAVYHVATPEAWKVVWGLVPENALAAIKTANVRFVTDAKFTAEATSLDRTELQKVRGAWDSTVGSRPCAGIIVVKQDSEIDAARGEYLYEALGGLNQVTPIVSEDRQSWPCRALAFFVTERTAEPPVAQTCLSAYVIAQPETMKRIPDEIARGNIAEFIGLATAIYKIDVVNGVVVGGTLRPVVDRWKNRTVADVHLVFKPGVQAPLADILRQAADQLCAQLTLLRPLYVWPSLPDRNNWRDEIACPAVLFLGPEEAVRLRVLHRLGNSASLVSIGQPRELTYREDGTAELHLPENAAAELANRVVTDIVVHRPQNPPDEAAKATIAEAVATTLRESGLTVEGPGARHEISEVERGLLPNDIGPNDYVVILRTKQLRG
jgi:hypothetical protein